MLNKHFIHRSKNRSQISLEPSLDPQDQGAYADSPLHSPGLPPQSAPSPHHDTGVEDEEQAYRPQYRSEEARYYQAAQPSGPHPTRSQSIRSPGLINTNQPTIQLVGPHNSASPPSSAIEDNPDRYYQQGPPPPPAHKTEVHKKKRSFFGLGSSSSSKDHGKPAPQKLGRSVSVRRKEEPQPPNYGDSENHKAQQQHPNWAASDPPISNKERDNEDGIASGRQSQYAYTGPAPQDRDPLHSPAFPPPLTYEDYVQGRSSSQGQLQNHNNKHTYERKGSYQSSWEHPAQLTTKHSRGESAQQVPSSYHPSPSSATSAASHPFAQRAPHEALHQYYHEHSRPPSQQSTEPPPSSHYSRTSDYIDKQENYSASSGEHPQGSMGPPQGQQLPPNNRRSSESPQQIQGAPHGRESGPYQPYSQGSQQGPLPPSNLPPPQYSAQLAPQGQNLRGTNQPSPMAQQGQREPDGRNTPPPNRSREELQDLDVKTLLLRHDELRMILYLLIYSPNPSLVASRLNA